MATAVRSVNRLKKTTDGNGGSLAEVITIPKLRYRTIKVEVIGRTPLIVHAWSAKAIKMMLDKQRKEPTAGREKKDPLQDLRGSLYYLPNNEGFGLPAPCFKAAIVTAANDVEQKMTEIKRNLHVNSYLVPIMAPALAPENWTDWDKQYEKELEFEHQHGVQMRMDMVRLESGVADIRFRGSFPIWQCELEIEFNESMLSAAEVVNLVQAAGYSGVGEWRPSSPKVKSGEFGRFGVKGQ